MTSSTVVWLSAVGALTEAEDSRAGWLSGWEAAEEASPEVSGAAWEEGWEAADWEGGSGADREDAYPSPAHPARRERANTRGKKRKTGFMGQNSFHTVFQKRGMGSFVHTVAEKGDFVAGGLGPAAMSVSYVS